MLEARGVEPPTRSVPAPIAGALARGGELAWRLLPLPGRAAADALRLLGGEPGVHARRLEGAQRARLRARHHPGAGAGGARRPEPALTLRSSSKWRVRRNRRDTGRRGPAARRPPRPGAAAPAGPRRRPSPVRRARLPGHLDGGDRGRGRRDQAGRVSLLSEQAGAVPRPARARGAAPAGVRHRTRSRPSSTRRTWRPSSRPASPRCSSRRARSPTRGGSCSSPSTGPSQRSRDACAARAPPSSSG